MKCYECGCQLSEKDFCTNCGVDVALYKKILSISNFFYNQGLEKAKVRDLSGAIVCLRQSLKCNKDHIEARNLLGLVYFEMGEVVSALSEWVISKNIKPNKNIADDYIAAIQSNPTRLDTINQTIKKYNQALAYCYQDSKDLAVIQLKKVLSLNPKFLQAHQLLALLYINMEEWDKARRELIKCLNVDINNTATLLYMNEVNTILSLEEEKNPTRKKRDGGDTVKYQSGNEVIIQPISGKEPIIFTTVINVAIGIALGLAAAWFLILPNKIKSENMQWNNDFQVISNQLNEKTVTIQELEQKVRDLTEANTNYKEIIDSYTGTNGMVIANDNLLKAVSIYLAEPNEALQVADYLEQIDSEFIESEASEAFLELYNELLSIVGPKVAQSYYNSGYSAYKDENYTLAVKDLTRACEFDPGNGEALYNLGNAYYKDGNTEKAREIYEKVVEQFPGTEKARKSQTYLDEINGE